MKTGILLKSLKNTAIIVVFLTVPCTLVQSQSNEISSKADASLLEGACYNLEHLARVTEKQMRYVPPDEEVECAIRNLESLAGITEQQLKYKAPSVESQAGMIQDRKRDEVLSFRKANRQADLASDNYTMQEIWLIRAGYYKSSDTQAWHHARNAFRSKKTSPQYASKF
jgi:hypothetical protein